MTNNNVLIVLIVIFISVNYSKVHSTSRTFIKTSEQDDIIELNKPSQILAITDGDKETTIDMSPDNPIGVIIQLTNSPVLSKKTKSSLKKSASLARITGEQYQIEAEIQSVFNSMSQKFKDVALPAPQIRHHYKNMFNGVAMTIPRCMLKSIRKIQE